MQLITPARMCRDPCSPFASLHRRRASLRPLLLLLCWDAPLTHLRQAGIALLVGKLQTSGKAQSPVTA